MASVNGLVQPAIGPSGLSLIHDGNATIEGRFVNEGVVGAMTPGGRLTITGPLGGHGGQFYYGRTMLTAGTAAEHGSGRLGFGGGDLSFAAGSVLKLSIAGTPDSGLYDQLTGIGQLDFQSHLNLFFEPSFNAMAGGHYALLGFGSATGRLGAADIVVTGLEAWWTDASRLLIDGSTDLAPVPEPATTALWAAGLGVLAWGSQRAKRTTRKRAARLTGSGQQRAAPGPGAPGGAMLARHPRRIAAMPEIVQCVLSTGPNVQRWDVEGAGPERLTPATGDGSDACVWTGPADSGRRDHGTGCAPGTSISPETCRSSWPPSWLSASDRGARLVLLQRCWPSCSHAARRMPVRCALRWCQRRP